MNSRSFFLVLGGLAVASATDAATLDLIGRPVDLAVNPVTVSTNAPAIGGQADLTTSLMSFQTRLHLGLETGPHMVDGRQGRWDGGQMSFGAVWAPSDRARLEFDAGGQRRRDLDLISADDISAARRDVLSQETQARAAAVISPLNPVSLTVGGETSARIVRTDLSADPVADRLLTRSRAVFSTLSWRPSQVLQFEGGGRLHSLGVDWVGTGDGSGDYSFVEPEAAGTLTPWAGAAWRLSVARVVEPLNTDQFVGFAKAAAPGPHAAFAPDQAWRYQAAIRQSLWDDSMLSATLTSSKLQSVTDFGPAGGVEAPINIGGGERQEVEGVLTTPIAVFGLNGTSLRARTAWRKSQVRDPFTGQNRRASGEAPYEAELSVSQALGGMNWGLAARAQGPASTWQMSQVVTRSANAGLGAFVEYDPGPLKVRLNLDNMVGGERMERTIYYSGSRALGQINGLGETRTADRVIGLTLTRPLGR